MKQSIHNQSRHYPQFGNEARIRHAAIPCARFTTRSRGAHARLGHCLALAVTFVGTPVWAQAAALLEEVVVTATLLPETSTSVSASII